MLLAHLLGHLITIGTLRVIDADGEVYVFSGEAGPEVTVRLHDRALGRKLFLNPRLHVGEAYMDGTLTVENGGTIYDFLDLASWNMERAPLHPLRPFYAGFGKFLRRLQQYNPVHRARENVAHHYDLSERLYELFLDKDRQYSCAYFRSPEDDLDTAQLNKKRHLAAKLLLKPGQRVLDIGSGWGGLALYLARECDVDVTGLTLSVEQHKLATERAAAAGLADRVRFHLRDYREEKSTYDRIVSVGMFEHVGIVHFQDFFGTVKGLLEADGVAVIHAIGRGDGPGVTNPWIRKYIFPGGYSPALSEVLPAVERSGLWVTDIEILRLHYAETLRAWRQRFEANRAEIRKLYDERFCRMWEFYLAASEVTFRRHEYMVWQMQLTRTVDAVPLQRDYIVDWERSHMTEHMTEAGAQANRPKRTVSAP
ncbi:MAG TPA: cyclopropane-fatty-acyl-phospholipid synthase family protein [Stellaceae bacterium]|jgi:cyclopropane-fatty-acyl-phospholipid synthase|nr:cyclopropane-fatty-acyl-phospholipid synthase family protein [Stellaceae bacterium]